jgi:hypothetical protein
MPLTEFGPGLTSNITLPCVPSYPRTTVQPRSGLDAECSCAGPRFSTEHAALLPDAIFTTTSQVG